MSPPEIEAILSSEFGSKENEGIYELHVPCFSDGDVVTSIDRTAYPRFTRHLSQRELKSRYAITPDEHHFIFQVAKSSSGRLTLAILLKARQQLGYFPSLNEVPLAINAHLANLLGEPENTSLVDAVNLKKTAHIIGYLFVSFFTAVLTLVLVWILSNPSFRKPLAP